MGVKMKDLLNHANDAPTMERAKLCAELTQTNRKVDVAAFRVLFEGDLTVAELKAQLDAANPQPERPSAISRLK